MVIKPLGVIKNGIVLSFCDYLGTRNGKWFACMIKMRLHIGRANY